jgi:hypothetical protein
MAHTTTSHHWVVGLMKDNIAAGFGLGIFMVKTGELLFMLTFGKEEEFTFLVVKLDGTPVGVEESDKRRQWLRQGGLSLSLRSLPLKSM